MKVDWFMITVLALVVPVGGAFVLLWWKQADNWADAEHKRFKTHDKPDAPRVVVKSEESEKQRG